jgi:asparagine N-glycosylation enzyme membrane subunit Stt3
VGFWFVRRLYDSTTASIYATALAVMPTAIAHSRICQDPSQSVFWTGLVVYLSLLGFRSSNRVGLFLAAALATTVLWSLYLNYFRTFLTTGGRSHPAYVTAPVEPKQQALAKILAVSPAGSSATIVTQQWWLYWARSDTPRLRTRK